MWYMHANQVVLCTCDFGGGRGGEARERARESDRAHTRLLNFRLAPSAPRSRSWTRPSPGAISLMPVPAPERWQMTDHNRRHRVSVEQNRVGTCGGGTAVKPRGGGRSMTGTHLGHRRPKRFRVHWDVGNLERPRDTLQRNGGLDRHRRQVPWQPCRRGHRGPRRTNAGRTAKGLLQYR